MRTEPRKEAPRAADPCCPVCGGALTSIKCKVMCTRCHAVVSNCNGD